MWMKEVLQCFLRSSTAVDTVRQFDRYSLNYLIDTRTSSTYLMMPGYLGWTWSTTPGRDAATLLKTNCWHKHEKTADHQFSLAFSSSSQLGLSRNQLARINGCLIRECLIRECHKLLRWRPTLIDLFLQKRTVEVQGKLGKDRLRARVISPCPLKNARLKRLYRQQSARSRKTMSSTWRIIWLCQGYLDDLVWNPESLHRHRCAALPLSKSRSHG